MFKPECLICRDYKRVESENDACQLAYQNLSRITRRIELPRNLNIQNKREYHKYFLGLDSNRPSTRLMCGSACSKVSTQSGQRFFDLLKKEHEKIVYALINSSNEDDFNKLKRKSLSLLRGNHLGKFYHSIDSIRFRGGEN